MTRILVACGTGVAAAAAVAAALAQALKGRGISVDFTLGAIAEVPRLAPGHDLIVSTTPIAESGGVPVIHTLAFLTGVETERVLDRIVAALGGGAARDAASRGDLHV